MVKSNTIKNDKVKCYLLSYSKLTLDKELQRALTFENSAFLLFLIDFLSNRTYFTTKLGALCFMAVVAHLITVYIFSFALLEIRPAA